MVDADRVDRLLRGVTERVAQLRNESTADQAARARPIWINGVKYLFVTAIEGCLDVAHHIAASEQWATPDTNAAAFRLLGRHAVLDPATAEVLAAAAGFRNLLVHQYAEVDDDRVVEFFERLGGLDEFVAQVVTWLDGSGGGGAAAR